MEYGRFVNDIYLYIVKKFKQVIKSGVVMKHYKALLAIFLMISYGLDVSAAYNPYSPNVYNPNALYTNAPSQSYQGAYVYPYGPVPQQESNAYQQPNAPVVNYDTTVYPLVIATSGEDRIVDAIKRHSDLTEADEKRWTFYWVPFVGSSIHDGLITKVRDFMRVCRGLEIAKSWFNNQDVLMAWFRGHDIVEICKALDNLSKQGGYAKAVLGQVGTVGEKNLYEKELDKFIENIKINKQLMSHACNRIKQQRAAEEQQEGFKSEQEVRRERNKYEANKVWWKTMALRWKMTKDVGTAAFNGAKWALEKANENGVPLLSAAAVWLVYNKLFGASQPVAK